MLITRPPEAAESQYIIVSSSIIPIEKVSTLSFYNRTMIPLFLCKSRQSMFSTTFVFTLLLHMYDMLIYGMVSKYQYLIMHRFYFIAMCIGLGVCCVSVMFYMLFLCILLLFVPYKHIAIQHPRHWAITRLSVFQYIHNTLPTAPTSIVQQDDATITFCAYHVCFLYINHYRIL